MVVIRVNGNIKPEDGRAVHTYIHEQAKTGVIVLPHFCELLNEVPADEEIKVVIPVLETTPERLVHRLRACVHTVIDPELAMLAANTIELQQASLAGNCDRVEQLEADLEALKEKYKKLLETADILDAALRAYQRKYGE